MNSKITTLHIERQNAWSESDLVKLLGFFSSKQKDE